MNPDLAFWFRTLATLALETAAVLTLAALVAPRLHAARHQRAVWLAAFWALWLITATEMTGLRLPGTTTAPSRHPSTPPAQTPNTPTAPAPSPASHPHPIASASTSTPTPFNTAPQPSQPHSTWWPGCLWLAGTAATLAWRTRKHLRLASLHRHHSQAAPAAWSTRTRELAQHLGLHQVTTRVLPGLKSPIAFGLRSPTITLPVDFSDRFDAPQQDAILLHELAHLARRDPLALILADLTTAILWWHPGVAWARHQLVAAMESAADEASSLIPDGPTRLAESLLRLGQDLTNPASTRALGITGPGPHSQLARRIHALVDNPTPWHHSKPLAHTLPLLAASFAALAVALPAWPGTPRVPLATYLTTTTTSSSPTPTPTPSPAPSPAPPANDTAPATNPDPNPNPNTNGPTVTLEVKVLEITEHDSSSLGLDWLFGHASTAPDPVQTDHPAPDEPAANSPNAANVRIDRSQVAGQSVVLQQHQVNALLLRLQDLGNGELTACPRIQTLSGRPAEISIRNLRTLVTGVETNPAAYLKPNSSQPSPPVVNYTTETLGFGPTIAIIPTRETDAWRIRLHGMLTEFLGYDDPGPARLEVSTPDGSLTAQLPLPRLRVRKAIAEGLVAPGQSLLVRGPAHESTERTRGSWFRPPQTIVKRVRLYLVVTPIAQTDA